MDTRITVNGQEYRSIEEMPPDVRRQYERVMSMMADRDRNGVPDIMEGKADVKDMLKDDAGKQKDFVTTVSHQSSYVINGREYNRLEDVPPEIRRMLTGKGSMFADGSSTNPRATFSISKALRTEGGGFTFRVTWSTLFALLAALAVVGIIAWFARG
jgi:hypothetical protein